MTQRRAFLDGNVVVYPGDCREVMRALAPNSVDSVVTDPPYHLTSIVQRYGKSNLEQPADKDLSAINAGAYRRLARGFMGQQWDGGGVAFEPETWAEAYRVLKPGGHLLAFSGSRTYHRMVCAIEDAGFEIRDQIMWVYGSGFPKSLDVSKALDKADGHWRGRAGAITIPEQVAKGTEYERTDKGEPITPAAREWAGWHTALKPSHEPIVLARKPLSEPTVAANVLRWGTGAINVDGCRVAHVTVDGGNLAMNPHLRKTIKAGVRDTSTGAYGVIGERENTPSTLGRWPANLIHSGEDEVLAAFPEQTSGGAPAHRKADKLRNTFGAFKGCEVERGIGSSSGSAARFFYTAKADG